MYEVKYVIVGGSAIVFSAAIQHKDMVGYNQLLIALNEKRECLS